MPAAIAIPAIMGGLQAGMGLIGAKKGATAATDASNVQIQGGIDAQKQLQDYSGQGLNALNGVWEQQQSNQAPWMQTGKDALGTLWGEMNGGALSKGFDPSTVQMDPSFDFMLQRGQQALDRSAAARTGTLNGGAVKAATRYAEDYTKTGYGDAYNRAFNTFNTNQSNRFNRLASVAGMGQHATDVLGQEASVYGQGVNQNRMNTGMGLADLTTQIANARASGYTGRANAWTNGLDSVGRGIGTGVGMWQRMNQPSAPGAYQAPQIYQPWADNMQNYSNPWGYDQSTGGYQEVVPTMPSPLPTTLDLDKNNGKG